MSDRLKWKLVKLKVCQLNCCEIICFLFFVFFLRNTIFIIFLQQILSYRLLLTIIGQNSNLTGGFKLDPVTT